MQEPGAEVTAVAALLRLEQQLRKATCLPQLYFTIVNETHECIPYSQAALLIGEELKHLRVVAASDIPRVDHTSPYMAWVGRLAGQLATRPDRMAPAGFGVADVPAPLRSDWREMAPPHLLWLPLPVAAMEDRAVGALLLFRTERWSEAERGVLEHLAGTIAHALFALSRRNILRGLAGRLLRQRLAVPAAVVLLAAAMWLPVRMSALAPVEVIPKDPLIVASAINGAVKRIEVEPNQIVNPGDLLVQFEDTELAGEMEVSMQALLVSQAKLQTAQQSSFLNQDAKARLAELASRVRQQEAELEFVRSRYSKARLVAPGAGIAVLDDPNEWQGRPVAIGERILQVADPHRVELRIMLPVKDSIALREDAKVLVFFDNDPLHAWPAVVSHAEYEPQMTAEGVLAYRLIAEFSAAAGENGRPRIGTRGTAKVYGRPVALCFYLFRRPITAVRQRLGW